MIGRLVGAVQNHLDTRKTVDAQFEIMGRMLQEMGQTKLEYTRWGRSILEQFLVALDSPETHDELRETLIAALQDMNDEVARQEEHVPG